MTNTGKLAVTIAGASTALIAAAFAEPTMAAYRALYLHEALSWLICQ